MKAQLTLSQIYYNSSLLNFFFRSQAENTFNALFEAVSDIRTALNQIEAFAESENMDLVEFEEMCYCDSVPEIAEFFGLELA